MRSNSENTIGTAEWLQKQDTCHFLPSVIFTFSTFWRRISTLVIFFVSFNAGEICIRFFTLHFFAYLPTGSHIAWGMLRTRREQISRIRSVVACWFSFHCKLAGKGGECGGAKCAIIYSFHVLLAVSRMGLCGGCGAVV